MVKSMPDRVDEGFRMSLVAIKEKIMDINKVYGVDLFDEAIDYLKDAQELNKDRMRILRRDKNV